MVATWKGAAKLPKSTGTVRCVKASGNNDGRFFTFPPRGDLPPVPADFVEIVRLPLVCARTVIPTSLQLNMFGPKADYEKVMATLDHQDTPDHQDAPDHQDNPDNPDPLYALFETCLRRPFITPRVPHSPERVQPKRIARELQHIIPRILEINDLITTYEKELDEALCQYREALVEEKRHGRGKGQSHGAGDGGGEDDASFESMMATLGSTSLLRSLRNDILIARRVIRCDVSAYRHAVRFLRGPDIDNGRETVLEIHTEDSHIGFLVVRQAPPRKALACRGCGLKEAKAAEDKAPETKDKAPKTQV